MSLLALGLNHKTAPVAIRERVAFGAARLQEALYELKTSAFVQEAAILSTCNRTEIYCGLHDPDIRPIGEWLSRFHALPYHELAPYLYSHPDQLAVRHMLRVASGLDSLVLGEPQILGQMKDAYQSASHAGTLGSILNRLFQHIFFVAKKIRTDTAIGASPVSVAFAAVRLAQQIFGDLSPHTALLVGAGETIELVARHLTENSIGRIIIANRTVERAHHLAAVYHGYAISLEEIPAHLAEADIVITSTASPLPILGKGAVETALKARKHRPIFMVDIAVPRDIEPEVATLEDIFLYTVDDLHDVIAENMRSRQEAAEQAEEIIEDQCSRFMGWIRTRKNVDTLCLFREHIENIEKQVLIQAKKQLQGGHSPEAALEWLAHTLTQKFLHTPSVQLRQAGYEGREDIVHLVDQLFRGKNA